ncbi:MAG: exonuclease subunit SbcD [Myxococcales bacterium]|jgi:exonuclease SbcD|nr:exonuclease subunit SbcD [Myxococcales bacterium]
MKVLHTSDWHLGRTLYGKRRYGEFEAFFNWLAEAIEEHDIDVLLVAGDIFDTTAPSNRAQEIYYRFLRRVTAAACRHVVIVAGNHDSPSFLNAPKTLLRALNVHVVGHAAAPEDEVLVLRDAQGAPELIVCAVPHLRDRDIRTVQAGEDIADKERKLLAGIREHYAAVGALAAQKRAELGGDIPIIGTGHLFTAGGKTTDGDGVRELYVGSLAHVTSAIFPACFDYVALGHLHVPQPVGGAETIRYSGSPLPMGFGEARQQKSLCRVSFDRTTPTVALVDVPVFQTLERVKGDWTDIEDRIRALAAAGSRAWLEVIYEGDGVVGDLRERLDTAVSGTHMEVLRVKNNRVIERVLGQCREGETLDDLDANEVFERCLADHGVPEAQRPELRQTYREAVASLREDDAQAM